MTSSWSLHRLGELGDFKNGVNYSQKDVGTDFPVATVKNLFRGRYVTTDGLDAISDGVISRIDDYLLNRGDLLFARSSVKREGSGQVAIFNDGPKGCVFSGFTIRFRVSDPQKVLPLYLLYLFRSPQYREEFTRIATGTTIHNLSQSNLSNVEITLPSFEEQNAIAHLLGVLDDKIELNRQMNETLEAMAQALFKSWFVDFDPVIDNALAAGNEIPEPLQARASARQALGDQRKPLPPEIQAQFPSTFVFTDEMGWIPEGWVKKTLGDFDIKLESGKRPKGGIDKKLKEGVPSVGAESLFQTGSFEYSKVKFVKQDFSEQVKKGWVQNYDVAIYKDGANVGDPSRVSMFGNSFPFERFMVNEHVFLLRSKEIGQPALYSLIKGDEISQQLKSMGTSKAAQPGLNQTEVLCCSFLSAEPKLYRAFNSLVLPMINMQLANGLKNQTLSELRDTLLPKLLSGELRLIDAEQQVAESS